MDPLTGHISTDIGPILKADADGVSQADDLMAISDIRNLLFANGGLQDNGQDLIARDIERARDDGIGTYNQVRQAYGLTPVTSFAQITSNVTVQQELQKAYGTVDKIDPFEGGMAEDHVAGSDLGPLFTKIIADQFNRLRAGDRFFYLNESWNADELQNHAAGQHAGQGHRGEHGDHEPSGRRLQVHGVDQRERVLPRKCAGDTRKAWSGRSRESRSS